MAARESMREEGMMINLHLFTILTKNEHCDKNTGVENRQTKHMRCNHTRWFLRTLVPLQAGEHDLQGVPRGKQVYFLYILWRYFSHCENTVDSTEQSATCFNCFQFFDQFRFLKDCFPNPNFFTWGQLNICWLHLSYSFIYCWFNKWQKL